MVQFDTPTGVIRALDSQIAYTVSVGFDFPPGSFSRFTNKLIINEKPRVAIIMAKGTFRPAMYAAIMLGASKGEKVSLIFVAPVAMTEAVSISDIE
jgi:hypothetical protein